MNAIERKLFVGKRLFEGSLDLYFLQFGPGEARAVASPVVMVETPESVAPTPFLTISYDQAQRLMDNLWDCGLRPSEGSGSAGALAATQSHLKDMQTLTFKLIDRVGASNGEKTS